MSPAAGPVDARAGALAAGLAFVAGYVDTIGFVALFGLFTAHVTGNFVLIGATLTQGGAGLLAKLLALPVFVLAVAAARLWVLRCERRARPAAHALLLAQAALLALFGALGLLASPIADVDAPLAIAAGMAGVAAMGVQNAASRTVFAALSPTTVMTGNVTQLVMDLVDLLGGRAEQATRARLAKLWPPVVAFAVGAVAGALAFVVAGFWSVAVAMLSVFGLRAALPR